MEAAALNFFLTLAKGQRRFIYLKYDLFKIILLTDLFKF